MDTPIYVINLDRSQDRLASVQASAQEFGWRMERVPAVDGKTLDLAAVAEFDQSRFERIHGRTPFAAEVGCYLSHLAAMDLAQHAEDAIFVVIEDDVAITSELRPLIDELASIEGWDIVKLVNHRTNGFRSALNGIAGFDIGRAGFGPCGSSAAYVVRKASIRRIRKTLIPMCLPYDVALERGWAGDVEVFTTDRPAIRIQNFASGIADSSVYNKTKFVFYRRIGTLLFRSHDFFRRFIYSRRSGHLKKLKH